MDSPALSKKLKLIEILREGWRIYCREFKLLTGIALLGSSLAILFHLLALNPLALNLAVTLLIGLPGFFLSVWGWGALVIAASRLLSGQGVSVFDAFSVASSRFGRLLVFGALYYVIGAGGLILLILPGIYWLVIFSLGFYVALLEDKSENPLTKSKRLVRGNFWKVLGLMLLSFWLVLVGDLVVRYLLRQPFVMDVIDLFLGPFFVVVWMVLYDHLKRFQGVDHAGSPGR